MANALPQATKCCDPCDDPVTTNVPGPAGADGAAGAAGTNGSNAYSLTAAGFTMPAAAATVNIEVDDSAWFAVGQSVFIGAVAAPGSGIGHFVVNDVPDSTHVTLTNLGYSSNVPAGTVVGSGQRVSPAGPVGVDGTLTGAAGGQLGGNYPNPTLNIGTTTGDIIVNAGGANSDARMAAGADGTILVSDVAQPNGRKNFALSPNAATDNVIPRFDASGDTTPTPVQASLMLISDTGAIQSTPSGGNARGASAIDLQVQRGVATQVASATNSVVSGGASNTASAQNSVVSGGNSNTASGAQSAVSGGLTNAASGAQSVVSGGGTNTASAQYSTVGGGSSNDSSGDYSTISGGNNSTASGTNAAVGGGTANTAAGTSSTIGGGDTNTATDAVTTIAGGSNNTCGATAAYGAIGGGFNNTVNGNYACIPGGISNSATGIYSMASGDSSSAYLLGQMARASGKFAAVGDAQTSVLTARNTTTNATPTELLLDGASVQLAIPANTTWAFKILIAARRITVAENAVYTIVGAIKRDAAVGTTALVGAATVVAVAEDDATWTVAVQADAANGALQIMVTGAAGKTVKWVARVELAEVTFA